MRGEIIIIKIYKVLQTRSQLTESISDLIYYARKYELSTDEINQLEIMLSSMNTEINDFMKQLKERYGH